MVWSRWWALAWVGDCSWPSPGDCEGFCTFPAESRKVTLVDCSCHWPTSFVHRFLRYPIEDEVRATPLSRRTTKCWSTQWGCSVSASTWTPGEKSVSQLCLIGILPVLDCSYIGDWSSPTWRYKYLILSIYLPQSSVISLVAYFVLCSIVP